MNVWTRVINKIPELENAMAKMRGAKPTPRHKLLVSSPHRVVKVPPPQFAVVPKQLSMWDNDVDGDCVTAEEAYAKAVWSIQSGLPELFVPDAEVIRWATAGGYLNGATLTDVMDSMIQSGFQINGQTYNDGPYNGVDWTNETVLQSAIATGPVKIGIDANALPPEAGIGNGWYSITTGQFGNEDHCVGLSGYGSASYLFSQLGVPVPTGLDPTTTGYLLFTWDSIGFVTHGWLMGTCAEAWVRNPTTPGQGPTPVPPVPPSPPYPPSPPIPPVPGIFSGTLTYSGGLLVTVTPEPSPAEVMHSVLSDPRVTAALTRQVQAGPIPWMKVIMVLVADIAAKKPMSQIIADVLAALAGG